MPHLSGSCLNLSESFSIIPDSTSKYIIIPYFINKRHKPSSIIPSSIISTSNTTYYSPYRISIQKVGYKDFSASFELEKGLDTFIALESILSWNYSIAPKFLIRNTSTTGIFKISPSGDLAIAGNLYENTNSPPTDKIIWSIGDLIYLTNKGDLYIKGNQLF